MLLGAGPFGMVSGNLLPSMGAELRLAERFLAAGLPVIGTGLGSAILAVAAGGGVEAAPLRFVVGSARRRVEGALDGYLPEHYPLVRYGRDRALPPAGAAILAADEEGAPALFQIGALGLGFAGHPGMKRAMVEDLVMEFEETPEGLAEGLVALGGVQRALADALSRTMVGLVGFAGLMPAP
jgi:GMP synthase-like glutamine amidotransferase